MRALRPSGCTLVECGSSTTLIVQRVGRGVLPASAAASSSSSSLPSSSSSKPRPYPTFNLRSLATMPPYVKKFQTAKTAYASEVAAVRKEYIAQVQERKEAEQAKQLAETARIKEAKRQRLLVKAAQRKKNMAIFLQAQKEQRERFERYLAAMQEVREAYTSEVRAKQANLLKALTAESSLWITPENVDEKITDDLFAVAGRTTFTPTQRSRDWQFMALPRVPDFSAYSEEDLFDEKEDKHFLTDKSPWRAEEGSSIVIPEGHHFYTPGPAENLPRKLSSSSDSVDEEGVQGEEDNILYFEDAAYRPSFLAALYQGAYEDFQPSQVPDGEVEHIRELAERYEEQLQTILKQSRGREGKMTGAGGASKKAAFDPKAFSIEQKDGTN
ncbi:hypothetical protein VYU27_002707 [Nannochloropsis oceanica]